ncbi:sec1 family domain-containing protein [Ditylenchus destructor]|uniref:Sec1 family domain-containing protein n=1 Tax=Ditylenchus destructor TaxID=166010 RepID=A0AAD4NF86_9BILA|nr:sec1 family domain-containing protein [Ditylenchus destructor]
MIGHGDWTESIRSRQITSLKQVLNLNQPVPISMAVEPVWKLLILDRYGQEIISPLIRVKQLRELGITLHLLLESKREPLPDVPAVYFCSPTEANILIICEDLKKALYDSYYLNMIYPISRPSLEALAASAVQGGTTQQVQKLTDQYLSFISLEEDLFMLRKYSEDSPFSFFAINDPRRDAPEIDDIVNTVANGLFAVCVTLGVVPIIKCSKNFAAEQVAQKLDQKIRENLRDARNNLFVQESIRAGQLNLHRPVLVIADRSMDLSTMLHHTWTYQALISDVLNMQLNRVRMTDKSGKRKEYDMCPEDKLWSNFKGSPFPLVAEAIEESLEAYRKNEEEIKRLKNTMGMQNPDDESVFLLDDATAKLQSAVGNLPELLEQKRLIDLHTSIATSLLENIKERKLDLLFETEEKLLNGQNIPVNEDLRVCTNKQDALRIALIALCSRALTAKERKELLVLLEEKEIDPAAYHFVQKLKSFSTMANNSNEEFQQGAGTKTVNMFSKLLNHSSRFVMEGVKNLVPKKHNLPLTKMVDEMIDTRVGVSGTLTSSNAESDDYRCFDPKLLQNSKDAPRTRTGQLAMDVIVFVVGGGNYVEYQNIVEYGKTKGLQRITYGCTEMVNPTEFVDQLTRLGQGYQ